MKSQRFLKILILFTFYYYKYLILFFKIDIFHYINRVIPEVLYTKKNTTIEILLSSFNDVVKELCRKEDEFLQKFPFFSLNDHLNQIIINQKNKTKEESNPAGTILSTDSKEKILITTSIDHGKDTVLNQIKVEKKKSSHIPGKKRGKWFPNLFINEKWKRKKKPFSIRPSMLATGEVLLKALASTSSEDDTRMVVAQMEPFKVESKKNIACAVLGNKKGESIVNFFIYNKKTRIISHILAGIYIIGHIVGILSLFRIISPDIGAVGAFTTIPSVITSAVLLFITDILIMLLLRFETWYMIYNLLGACVALCLLLRDIRMIYIIIGLGISAPTSAFFDSLPSGHRRLAQIIIVGTGLMFLGTLQLGLYYNWYQVEPVSYDLGAIKFTASGFAATCITNAMIYFLKNLLNSIFYPDSLVVIKSKVASKKMKEVEARIVSTAFHIKEINNNKKK